MRSSSPAHAPAAFTTMAQATGWYSRLSRMWICVGGTQQIGVGGHTIPPGDPHQRGERALTWTYLMRVVSPSSGEVTKPAVLLLL